MPSNPYQKYKSTKYETASQEKLLIMLYEGAIKFSNQAKQAIDDKDIEGTNKKLQRVQAIINELRSTLNMEAGGEIANNLDNLYEYMNRRLIQANIRKDKEIVDEIIELLAGLKDSWEQASQKLKSSSSQQTQTKERINIEG